MRFERNPESIMKLAKAIVLVLVALLLTGCYTQLQYSQTMKKVTDREKSWSEDQEGDYDSDYKQSGYDSSEYAYEEDDYIPVYYKDYEYEEKYNECGCNPYNIYNFYGSSFDRYGHYGSYYSPYYSHLTVNPYFFHKWRYSHRYWRGIHGPHFGFSISWGNPYYAYNFFYDPFFDPYYDFYWYGYNHPFAYNYRYFYGHRGYAYYHGSKNWSYERKDRKYGPRQIGTNRVSRNAVRTRSRDDGNRNATISNSSRVRSRSTVGTSKTRSKVDRTRGNGSSSKVSRTRDNNGNSRSRGSSGNNRSRSRDNVQGDDNTDQRNRSGILRSRTVMPDERSLDRRQDLDDLRSRYQLQWAPKISDREQQREQRSLFFNRMKNFLESSASHISRNIERSTSNIRRVESSSTHRSAVRRSNNSGSNKSSVTRSRSSNNNSRSRGGSSSGSRSRDSGSSDSDRSRGGN